MVIVKDGRIGDSVRYILQADEALSMVIPPEIPKCVVFVMLRKADASYSFKGTAFLVSKPSSDLRHQFTYAVTAKHVIDKSRDLGCDKVYLRFNDQHAGSFPLETSIGDWKYHPSLEQDPKLAVDIAVVRLPDSMDNVDHLTFPLDGCLTDEVIDRCEVGLGDEVFFPGLFVHHFGLERNIPVLRRGTIATMPDTPVMTKLGHIQAYLIEARSLGGLSGSPVFLDLGQFRTGFAKPGLIHSNSRYYLLGIVHGHFDARESDPDLTRDDQQTEERINAGIAIVTPVSKLLEVINQPSMLDQDQRILAARQRQTLPEMD